MAEQIRCQVAKVQPLTSTIFRIQLIPERAVTFKAGQYLNVILSENDKRPFSIASISQESSSIELHIGASEFNAYAIAVVEQMTARDHVLIELPKGNAYLREESVCPLLLVAGGTGYSYVRAILLRALMLDPNRKIYLFWGGRAPDQLYDLPFLEGIAQQHQNVHIVTTVEIANANWSGKTGLLIDVVLQSILDMSPYDIYICGRFEMAKLARHLFCEQANADVDHIFGDAFTLPEK